MKNVQITGKSWDDLIRQKKLLAVNKEMVVGSTGVQWAGECEIKGKKTWILIYRSAAEASRMTGAHINHETR